ncbi:DUF6119 family protein [Nocardia sp. NPDC004722]
MTTSRVSPCKRVTLYRFAEGTTLIKGLQEQFRAPSESFDIREASVENLDALLAYGAFDTASKWTADIAALTGIELPFRSHSPGAVLLISESPDNLWALTWGVGFHMLDNERIDFRFGTRIVARSALASEIRSITKTVLDHRARVDRSTLPNGSNVLDLGVDGYGEVISRIEAKARIPELRIGDKVVPLRAADSLSLPLAKRPAELIEDLRALTRLLTQPVQNGLESIEQLAALKPGNPAVEGFEKQLAQRLSGATDEPIGISLPHERLDLTGHVACYKATGFGDHRARTDDDLPDIGAVLAWFEGKSPHEILNRLGTITLQLFSDPDRSPESALSPPVALRRWLAFEVLDNQHRYCLHDGQWFLMDDHYRERIDQRVDDILAQRPSFTLPPWPRSEKEDGYNSRAATSVGGLLLDRKLISTPLHARGGIEPCDIFRPPGTLIHVKRAYKSDRVSHLLAQALVSAEALARDEWARDAWRQRIESLSGGAIRGGPIREVVVALGHRQPFTTQTLFTFSKVNLVRQYDQLRSLGLDVRIATIPEV